jgi:hypothetical protein
VSETPAEVEEVTPAKRLRWTAVLGVLVGLVPVVVLAQNPDLLGRGMDCGIESVPTTTTESYVPLPPGVEAELEQLMQDVVAAHGDRWAGATLQADGTVLVGLTRGPVPEELAANSRVQVVYRKFTSTELQAIHRSVGERLDDLLAPGRRHLRGGGPHRWRAVSDRHGRQRTARRTGRDL